MPKAESWQDDGLVLLFQVHSCRYVASLPSFSTPEQNFIPSSSISSLSLLLTPHLTVTRSQQQCILLSSPNTSQCSAPLTPSTTILSRSFTLLLYSFSQLDLSSILIDQLDFSFCNIQHFKDLFLRKIFSRYPLCVLSTTPTNCPRKSSSP